MRRLFSRSALALALMLLSACGQNPATLAPYAQGRVAASGAVETVAGRVLLKWRDAALGQAIMRRLGIRQIQAIDATGDLAVDLPSGVSAQTLVSQGGVALAYTAPDVILRSKTPQAVDKAGSGQWGLDKVQARQAWQITRGAASIKIAVVDTGCDLKHPDLAGQIVDSYNAIGWRKLVGGSAMDDNGHGTHCAGVVAATGQDPQGTVGMAPGCKLLIAKALDAEGSGAVSDIARGVNWAISHGASVISLSMGSTEDNPALRTAVATALSQNIVIVAAMGNDGKTLKEYPAAYPGVIAVGATDANDQPASFSTRGDWISVAAPGVGILSTTPTYTVTMNDEEGVARTYGTLSGTSMATPMVAGLAGLVRSQHPDWTPAQVKQAIESSADDLGGFNSATGHGRINAGAALSQ